MSRCSLPVVVLSVMFKWYTGYYYDRDFDFKRSLPLLAVCRLWRCLAFPMVYSRAIVEHEEKMALRLGRLARGAHVEMPATVAVKTNLDLIAAIGCVRGVKRVDITVRYRTNPFPGWRDAIQRMRAVTSEWGAVELVAAMHPSTQNYDDDDVGMTRYVDDIAEVGDALAALMPNVHSLECRERSRNPIARSLYGRLAGHYTDQLRSLNSYNLITMPPDRQFTRLRKVCIYLCNDGDHPLPRMASEELLDMNLVNQTPNHSWAPFSAHSDSRAIEFTKLQKLHVSYCSISEMEETVVRHKDGHPWKLHFPSLRALSFNTTGDICPFLEYAVLPRRMEVIYIMMPAPAYRDIADLVLPATKSLVFVVTDFSGGDPSDLHTISRLIDRARGTKWVELSIGDDLLPVTPEYITCTALTHMMISRPVSVDTMLAFLGRMPKLVMLILEKLDSSNVQTDMSVPTADGSAIIAPLSTSLRELTIDHDKTQYSPDLAVAAVKYMLLKTPALTKLVVAQISKDQVLDFVNAYAPRHRHLSGIRLRFNEGKPSW